MQDLNLYIHIPFCRKKCLYCDFYSVTDTSLISSYFAALAEELQSYEDIIKDSIIKTIYVGGGTPSLVAPVYYMDLFSKLALENVKEASIEVNPDSFDHYPVAELKSSGFNRLSVGVQSFVAKELKYLGRLHDRRQALQSIERAGEYFDNISLDLIYGLPEQNSSDLLSSLQLAFSLPIKHISAYELTIYPNSPLYARGVRQDQSADSYYFSRDLIEENGFRQYEISNFAREGFECRHNLGYWQDSEFIGLGVSAASYFHNQRSLNISTVQQYLKRDFRYTQEPATESEYIMSALRTNQGMSLEKYRKKFKEDFQEKYQEILGKLQDMVAINTKNIYLTDRGQIFANRVFEEFV